MSFAVCEARTSDYPIAKRIMKYVEPAVIQMLTEQEVLVNAQVVTIYYVLDSGVPGRQPYTDIPVCFHYTPIIVELSDETYRRLNITLDMYEDDLEAEDIFACIHLYPLEIIPTKMSKELANAFRLAEEWIK